MGGIYSERPNFTKQNRIPEAHEAIRPTDFGWILEGCC